MSLFQLLLGTHIIGGSISLLLGAYLLIAPKGGKRHRLMGTIYFYAMLVSALLSLPMAFIHPNQFLFIVGVFTSYMLVSGKRYLKKGSPASVKLLDWMITGTLFLFGIAFVVLGTIYLIQSRYFGVVLLAFGTISLLFVKQDYRNFRGNANTRNFGLTSHLQRMIGSYIASVTAFLVINNTILPPILAWLLPTVILVPLIVKWSRKHEIRKNSEGSILL